MKRDQAAGKNVDQKSDRIVSCLPSRAFAHSLWTVGKVRLANFCFVLSLMLGGCGGPESVPVDPESPNSNSPVETIESQLASAQRLLESGDVEGANAIVSKVLVVENQNGQAMVLAGRVALANQDVDTAVAMFDSAAEVLPEQSAVLMAQATNVLWQANRLHAARQHFESLLKKHPQFDDARRGLATLLNRQGFRFDANQQIRMLCRRPGVQPTIDELRCLLVPARSYVPFEEKPNVNDLAMIASKGELNVVRALFGEGDVRDALQVLNQSDAIKRRHPDAVALRGQLLLEAQLFAEFEKWLSGAEKECQSYPAYWIALGGWAIRKQQYESAVRLIGEAILREPGDIAAYDRMQQALEAMKDTKSATAFEQRGIQLRGVRKMIMLILSSPDPRTGALRELAEQLDQVGRPFEAKSWRSLAGLKEGLGMKAAAEAEKERSELLGSESAKRTRAVWLCGLDLGRYQVNIAKLRQTSGRSKDGKAAAQLAKAVPAGTPVFANIAGSAGLKFQYVNADPPKDRYFLMHEAVGAGIACLDYDCDGNVDLYVGQGAGNAPGTSGKQPNLLARNLGAGFVSVTEWSGTDDRGYSLGVTSGDWNQDGFPDLIVGNMTTNHLLINQGDGSFRPREFDDPIWNDGKYTSSLAIADVTGDQIPDIVEVTYLDDEKIYQPLQLGPTGVPVRFPGPLHFKACLDRVFVGRGDGQLSGQFLDADSPSPGLGLLVTDIDGVVGNEIFVANDMKANHLWTMTKDDSSETFVDGAVARGLAYGPSGKPLACMGIAAADFDGNGKLDLHVTNFHDQWTNQYMQTDDSLFDDLTLPFRLDESTLKMLGFGTEAIDFDNNTTIDLVTGNGHIDDLSHEGSEFEMVTQFFIGDGSTLRLAAVQGDPNYWNGKHLTRGLVTLDWNRDGRTDFATSDLKEPLALLENRTESNNHWIQFRLVGRSSERQAIGTRVEIELQDQISFTHVVKTGDGYMSKNEGIIHCGMGEMNRVESIKVTWPDGAEETHSELSADSRWLLVQGDEPFLD